MTRAFIRTCPVCGKEGTMQLYLGGYLGQSLYKCQNCLYVGPVVIEHEAETPVSGAQDPVRVASASLNVTFNLIGLVFGLAFTSIGLLVGLQPVPQAALGIGLLIMGGLLLAVSGFSYLVGRVRNPTAHPAPPDSSRSSTHSEE